MKSSLASSHAEWLNEMKLAIEDAKEAKPFGRILSVPITDFDLFQLAPLVCLQFRGRKQKALPHCRVLQTERGHPEKGGAMTTCKPVILSESQGT
ncbi:MAG: hypothetical protein ABSH35_04965 [Isosphaeraceae bacterium]|jgi:hypothetical protein